MRINYNYLLLLLLTTVFYAQNTGGIGYQAVIYKPGVQSFPGIPVSTKPLANTEVCLRFTFLDGDKSTEYQETITVSTDEFGIVNTTIGEGVQSSGYAANFDAIVWNDISKTLVVELDEKGLCSSFTEISNQPFAAAPFAFNAITANSVSGIVAITNGGTGADNVDDALINLGAEDILNKSVDVLLDATSDQKYPSVKAVKSYVDSVVIASLKENVIDYTAVDGQVEFKTTVPITSGANVSVFRNGIRVSVVVISSNTLRLEPGIFCYAGDEIKIVQIF